MSSETFAHEDEMIMRLLQDWPDLLEIMEVTRKTDMQDASRSDLLGAELGSPDVT